MNKNFEIEEYAIISHLYGITTEKDVHYFELGNFAICDISYIAMNYPELMEVFSKKIQTPQNSYAEIDNYFLINKKIYAKTLKEAKSIFSNNSVSFINAVLYCIPILTPENGLISITKTCATDEIAALKNNAACGESYSTQDITSPVYIVSDKLFEMVGNRKEIFELLDTDKICELERKIKLAVSWIGQALKNTNIVESYLNICVAFETLLCYQKEFISESLISQMSEQTAFLIKNTLEDRKAIIKRIKELYKLRSQIAHNGTAKIEDKDFFEYLSIVKTIIDSIYNLIKEKEIKNSEKLREYIIDLKFSV